jgi:hypothetical protein
MIFPYSQDVKIIITNFVWHILFCTKHTSNNITQENKTNIAYAVALSIYCVITRTYFRLGPLPDMSYSGHVTLSLPVKKKPLGRIWRNIRLRMHRIYLRTLSNVTSGQ